MIYNINCWNKNCSKKFSVSCKDVDQPLVCSECAEIATFVNLGYVLCEVCSSKNRIRLPYGFSRRYSIRCGNCKTLANSNQPIRIYSLEQCFKDMGYPNGLNYCGRDYFEGNHNEVQIAKAAIARLSSRGGLLGIFSKTSAATPKKVMYIRRLGGCHLPGANLPIKMLQDYHAYCNFKLNLSHENAKFSGTLGQFANPDIFQMLVNNGLVEVWFDSPRTKNEFETLSNLTKFFSYFRA